jgi:hypothetical protein
VNYLAGVRHAHNPKVEGSNPSPATNLINRLRATGKIKVRHPHINPHISFATAASCPVTPFDKMLSACYNQIRKS